MSGYTKLFSSILASSIWNESDCVRIVWVTLLAMSDRNGIVDASVGGIAHQARKSREETFTALKVLMSPDPDSKNQEHDGRRLAQNGNSGYKILNYVSYRDGSSDDPEAVSARDRVRKYRERLKAGPAALIIERDGKVCGICGRPVIGTQFHIDHVVPLIHGGSSEIDNLQLAHDDCNQGKSGTSDKSKWRHESMPVLRNTPLLLRNTGDGDGDGVASPKGSPEGAPLQPPSVAPPPLENPPPPPPKPKLPSKPEEVIPLVRVTERREGFPDAVEKWITFRMSLKKPKTPWAEFFQAQVDELQKLPPGIAVALVNQSRTNGWQGIFFERAGAMMQSVAAMQRNGAGGVNEFKSPAAGITDIRR